MIKLDQQRLPEQFSRYAPEHKPTHAKLVSRGHNLLHPEQTLESGENHLRYPMIEARYSYGQVDDKGNFTAYADIKLVQTCVSMMTEESVKNITDPDVLARVQATKNLRDAGVVPTPGEPHKPLVVASARADDFRECDLDAYFAYFDHRLQGTVV